MTQVSIDVNIVSIIINSCSSPHISGTWFWPDLRSPASKTSLLKLSVALRICLMDDAKFDDVSAGKSENP